MFRIIAILTLFMVTSMGCFGWMKNQFCESKKVIIMREEVRTYLLSWIRDNVTKAHDLDSRFKRYGSPGRYKLTDSIEFDWEMLGFNEYGIIYIFGDNLQHIEAVWFGEGMRHGILVSLREDRQFPARFRKQDICYQLGEFAVYYWNDDSNADEDLKE